MNNAKELDDALSEPTAALIKSVATLRGDLLVVGAGGKMGPTFARMARRAFDLAGSPSRVIAVSRFTTSDLPNELRSHGVETISGDLFDANFVRDLPDAANILYLVGMK